MTEDTVQQALQAAIEHQQCGRFAEAEAIYRQVLARFPDHADALHLLGVLAAQWGRAALAIGLIGRAIAINPAVAEYHSNLGQAQRKLGQFGAALASLNHAIELKPGLADAHTNLGDVLSAMGRTGEAMDAFRRTIELDPAHVVAYGNLGTLLQAAGRHEEAIAAFAQRIRLRPDSAEAHGNLGALLLDTGQPEPAIESLRRTIALDPQRAEAHYNLGLALYFANRPDEAIDAYGRAIALAPDHARAHCGLGVAVVAGQADVAIGHFQRALTLRPDDVTAHSNLLLCEQYRTGVTPAGLARAHADWDHRHAARYHGSGTPGSVDRDPERPLRIGFVSADFRTHPVGCFLVPVLENLASPSCAVVCYQTRAGRDDLTRRLAAAANEWRDVFRLDDDALAEQIRADRIDVLVDLSGHTEGNRLLAFARRPAPVQIAWIGYPGTTGLAAMDYLIADRYHVPPTAEAHYRERILRMPDTYVCFDPPAEAPAVGPLPVLDRGYLTFGSFNNLAKLTPEVIATWAEILGRVPESRLLLVTRGLGGAGTRGRVHEAFAAAGANPDCVELRGKLLRSDLLGAYNEVDVALDPFPYSGGITTCEALWMGVPVVTCPGETFAGRHALAHLSTVGLTETIAADRRDYVERALALAQDSPRLAALRSCLREQVRRSPLCDGERFARELMALVREVWRQWCRE